MSIIYHLILIYHLHFRRRRTLVAIGTHDLDTIEGPFTYEVCDFVKYIHMKVMCVTFFHFIDMLKWKQLN